MASNLYATDGKCHNANRGTYGHECGKPAQWIGHKESGFASGFCDRYKEHGDEAVGVIRWLPFKEAEATPYVDTCLETAYGTTTRLSFQIRVF